MKRNTTIRGFLNKCHSSQVLPRSERAIGALFRMSLGIAFAVQSTTAAPRPWTPQDSISTRYVAVHPNYPPARFVKGLEFSPAISPDNRYVYFVVNYGDLNSDAERCELYVYSVEALQGWLNKPLGERQEHLAPYRSIRLSSFSSLATALDAATWDQDSRAILFLAMTSEGTQEVHRWEFETQTLEQLTHGGYRPPNQLEWFEKTGDVLFYREPASFPEEVPAKYPSEPLNRSKDGSVAPTFATPGAIFALSRKEELPTRVDTAGLTLLPGTLRVPSAGRWALGRSLEVIKGDDGKLIRTVPHFLAIDLDTGRSKVLVGMHPVSPTPKLHIPRPDVYWAADGQRAILVSTSAIPACLQGSAVKGSGVYIAEFTLMTQQCRVLEMVGDTSMPLSPETAHSVGWLKEGEELLVTHTKEGKPAEGTVYKLTSAGVESRTISASTELPQTGVLPNGMKFRLDQGANEPARIVVSQSGRQKVLWGPDPGLEKLAWMKNKQVEWREGQKTVTGGLTLPATSSISTPVPLVVQVSGYMPEFFLPDGPHRMSDAVQALAARGIAVLQIDLPSGNLGALRDRIDAATRALVRENIVDESRIGLNSFHDAASATYYAITHPGSTHLAAAISADFTGAATYANYVTSEPFRAQNSVGTLERNTGGAFWERKQKWVEEDPSFNVDRVSTPFLISVNGGVGYKSVEPFLLELVGAFAANEKPLEYLYLPNGNFELIRPLERVVTIEAVVDWMSYWLQGYDDPSLQKVPQYARWRQMREQQVKKTTSPVSTQ